MSEATKPMPLGGGLNTWVWGRFSQPGLLVAAAVFLIDQAHKWWMLVGYGIRDYERISIFPFFDLVYVLNTGISYSLFDSKSYSWQLSLAGFAVFAATALWIWLAKGGTNRLMAVSLGLIIGGALGNALDRVLLGGVADFFLLHAYGYSWYVFNVADVAIVAGVIGLLYESLIVSRNTAVKAP